MYCLQNNIYIDYGDFKERLQRFSGRGIICVISILICVIIFLFINQEVHAFNIEPSRIELSIPRGRQRGKTVTIDNSNSNQPLHLKIYVQDVIFLPDGTGEFPPAGSTEWSCANWVRIIPEEVDIPPRRTQAVRVNVSVPGEAKGGYYAMVFFESSPTHIKGLDINFRLGALLDITVPHTIVRKAQLASMSLVESRKIYVDIFNQGNVLLRPRGRIKILNSKGRKIKQLDFNPQRLSVLPKTLRKFYLELDKPLASGTYRLKAELDYGSRYLLVGELPVEIE